MPERVSARGLLEGARRLFDSPAHSLATLAPRAGRTAFISGGQWMRTALEIIRGEPLPGARSSLQWLGFIKYAIAGAAAILVVLAAMVLRAPAVTLLSIGAFYAVEAQMVFLIPVALDGTSRPFVESRRSTIRAGGTLPVMRVVLILAATMCFGGFLGRGFLRSWCLGCLAVCIWYEKVRLKAGSVELQHNAVA